MPGLPSTHYERLVQSLAGYGVHTLDPAGNILGANAGAGHVKGTTPDRTVGDLFSLYYTPEDRAADLPRQDLAAAATATLCREAWRLRKDGQKYWAFIVLEAIRDERGVLTGYTEITRDDSERQHTHRRQQESRDAQFQTRKLDALGQLTGGLAHDFNNILQGMLGALQLAQRRIAVDDTEKAQRLIEAGIGAGRRAAGLTHRLLAFARRQSLDPKPVDMNALVLSLEGALRHIGGETVNLQLALDAGLQAALCDPAQLESALLGLATNAREAMAAGGVLTIRTERVVFADPEQAREHDLVPGSYASLTVSDTGSGMSEDVLERAFDPFFTTKPTGQGTGLGLSMIYGFIKQSEGAVCLQSHAGQGATVRLYLPEAAAVAASQAAALAADPGSGGEPLILVVDDDDMIRELVTQALNESGYRASSAPDAAVALGMMRSGVAPDLLLTDVGLPGMNGRQLADAARELQAGLKVLFMTGYAANAAVGHGDALAPGMAIVMKPFDVGVLSEKIGTMLAAG
jgi:PAS domain S-box-containing protein